MCLMRALHRLSVAVGATLSPRNNRSSSEEINYERAVQQIVDYSFKVCHVFSLDQYFK